MVQSSSVTVLGENTSEHSSINVEEYLKNKDKIPDEEEDDEDFDDEDDDDDEDVDDEDFDDDESESLPKQKKKGFLLRNSISSSCQKPLAAPQKTSEKMIHNPIYHHTYFTFILKNMKSTNQDK
jgi:TATA-binding protein-associated factor Taf7